ncbi:MAG: o-succinylbenzoate synthase [Bacteroidia bacterium]
MGLVASISKHVLKFKQPATTSRGNYTDRQILLLSIHNSAVPNIVGVGECAPLAGLSIDDVPDYEKQLLKLVKQINRNKAEDFPFDAFPSIKFGLETALLDLRNGGKKIIFQNFYAIGRQGIPINGLVWMDNIDAMKESAATKIAKGYQCIKIKIGAHDFEKELELLAYIRSLKGGEELILRVDANGAFNSEDVMDKLNALKKFNLHSIEQPITAGQFDEMSDICAKSPVPIALDEELIGVHNEKDIQSLLKTIKPQFIVIKPNLIGGFIQSDLWIKHAKKNNIGWWITSALESNIGLNAIAQYAAGFQTPLHSGLGTGKLYQTNFTPYTRIEHGYLWRDMGHEATDTVGAPNPMM